MTCSKFLFWIVALLFVAGCYRVQPADYVIQKEAVGDSAMVVTAHPLATEVGLNILRAGGNAVDAAIAVQFALAVVYPAAGNIGGGGFMLVASPEGKVDALDFREQAPLSATRDMYLDEQGNPVEGLSVLGHLAAGVPGTVDGMVKAHARYGSLPWGELIEPAIRFAEEGFQVTLQEAELLNEKRDLFLEVNPQNIPFVKAKPWQEGDLLKQEDLAATLSRIQEQGRKGFYTGKTAELIIAEMQRGSGLISKEDLSGYESKWRSPIKGQYRGYTIYAMPPPSSGGVALLQLLEMMEADSLVETALHEALTMHLMVEASRRVYADRAIYLGDPDFVEVPVESLLDSTYLIARMASFSIDTVTPSDQVFAGDLTGYESEETTHFSILDAKGMSVSVTTTLNLAYGSKVVVQGAGFILNNEMDDFSMKPGVPNQFGLIGAEANAIQPKKRMLSSMTPTIVLKDNAPIMVVGSPGGSSIITTVFQMITGVFDFEQTLSNMVQAPRFHHQWRPDTIYVEPGFREGLLDSLRYLGHKVVERSPYGRVDAIHVTKGKIIGVADRRGDDHAAGY
jgi:gamma-glutamyltranspeptidase/glutathione hydrolase